MAEKKYYTKALGRAVAAGARPSVINGIHIIPRLFNKWSVVLEGRPRSLRNFSSLLHARAFAIRIANQRNIEELVIHSREGKIERIALKVPMHRG